MIQFLKNWYTHLAYLKFELHQHVSLKVYDKSVAYYVYGGCIRLL